MSRIVFSSIAAGLLAAVLATSALAQTGSAAAFTPRPRLRAPTTSTFSVTRTIKSMFVVTKAGVIATDPISLRRPAAKAYIEEIRKITQAPIKYVIYSHAHYDHIAGGKPFKDLGATFIAHKNAKARIAELKPADVVVPDQVVDKKKSSISAGRRLSCFMSAKIIPTALS